VASRIVGRDAFDVEDVVGGMVRDQYQGGSTVMTAISGVEIALWDLIGKACGQPVYRLLGGRCHDRLPAYANGWYGGARTGADYAERARAAVGRGYRALKFDPFGPGQYELEPAERRRSIELVEAVRDAVGPDVEILVEMHGRFAPAEALRIARSLAEFEPSWIEEPVPPENLKALYSVAQQVTLPVATGERIHDRIEFRELFELCAADVIQPDIGHLGGIGEVRKLAATAETHYVLVAPHNVGGPVLTAANLHLAACTPNFKIQEHFNDFADEHVKRAAPGVPEVVDGYFALPTAPGLGVELDLDFVAEHPSQGAHFDLYAEDWQFRGTKGAS
jgi:galactonate dehydratase